ncbi:hypothetical protein JR316_0010237 [Psilocybe cubensis]|uniref:Uncharacterized protein n=2 Tax=Psilocybe cubensis TaxID=181762 RepID=A0ACB8GRB9_PSICU|nr:hypothetical protein JR316_0010237 [Psilocybe cubensis]KAH9478004.1 hypothetical protein JR316_0010237 [Psilocybe cubensis]
MEDSISTSAESVRTLYQAHGDKSKDKLQEVQAWQWEREQKENSDVIAGPSSGNSTVGAVPHEPSEIHVHALVLPSPPSSPGPSRSPSVDSVSESSLPSVSSSFFFSSSAPGSPGRFSHPGSYPSSHPHSEHGNDHEHQHYEQDYGSGLIIPSLALPEALRRPTPFGQTLGNLKILVLGGQGAGKSFLTGLLLEDNEDVVDVGTWDDWSGSKNAYGKVLRASTDWFERREIFGQERYEPTKNVEIVELPGYSHDADAAELINRLKAIIEVPFRALQDALNPEGTPSAVIANMLAAPTSPLYTAMVFLLPSPPTPLDKEIIHALSTHIPLIVLPRLSSSSIAASTPHSSSFGSQRAKLSAFRPPTAVSLRAGLFHSPETVSLLRKEAVERFLRWWEVERAVQGILEGTFDGVSWGVESRGVGGKRRPSNGSSPYREEGEGEEGEGVERWSKEKWESEWMGDYSRDVALRIRESRNSGTVKDETVGTQMRRKLERRSTVSSKTFTTQNDSKPEEVNSERSRPQRQSQSHDCHPQPLPPPFDPLHLPSLLMFSFSLLGPLKARLGETIRGLADFLTFGDAKVQLAVGLTGGFCVGVGLGVWASGRGW